MVLSENRFSGAIDLGNLPESMEDLDVSENTLSGTVRETHGLTAYFVENEQLTMD